jgi:hypothetical protein
MNIKTLLIIAASAAIASNLGAAIVFESTFDTDRTTGGVGQALWITDTNNGNSAASSGGVLNVGPGSSGDDGALFGAFSSVVDLTGSNNTVILSFDISYDSTPTAQNNNLHFGLFNNGGTATWKAADSTGSNPGEMRSADGYWFRIATNQGDLGVNAFMETNQTDNSSALTSNGNSGASSIGNVNRSGIDDAATYSIQFTISYNSVNGSIDLSTTLNGNPFGSTLNVVSPVATSFDGLMFSQITSDAYTLDNLTVTAVPEPSSYALLLGFVTLGFILWRRRR